jgi:peptidoglycan/LPS O-acetylase OafA/YrhL
MKYLNFSSKEDLAQDKSTDSAIQGLRGLAVLAVLMFHFYPTSNLSGYLGVDIFFVISGFLITRNIVSKLESNSFDFIMFFQKRIIRIFPALLFMMVISFILATIVLFPLELSRYGKHALAGGFFLYNFMAQRENGYFVDNSAEKPLLHLWSLSVEWQFYLIWPIILFAIMRNKDNLKKIIMILLISFFMIFFMVNLYNPDLAFYMPFTRVWQFIAGGLVYFLPKSTISNKYVALSAILGLSIALGVGNSNLGGLLNTLIVTGSTCVLIYYSKNRFVNAIFSNVILVYFGNISYSLYLIHLPLLVYYNLVFSDRNPTPLLFPVMIGFAHLSTKMIENPLRNSREVGKISLLLGISMLIVSSISLILYLNPSSYDKIPWASTQIKTGDTGQADFFSSLFSNSYKCNNRFLYENSPTYNGIRRCVQSKPGAADIQIIGDSHAEVIYPGLAQVRDKNSQLVVRDGLPWTSNSSYSDVYSQVSPARVIIVAGRWFLNESFDQDLSRTLGYLNGLNKTVLVIGDTPSFSFDAEKCKYRRAFTNYFICEEQMSSSLANSKIERLIQSGQYENLVYIDFSKNFCRFSICSMSDKGIIFFRDNNHLNLKGSERVAQQVINSLPD